MNIISKSGVKHFERWQIIQTRWFGIYFHCIYQADTDKHCHDHPWDYISIPLWGKFIELKKNNIEGKAYYSFPTICFGQIIKRKAEDFHKIHRLCSKKVYTLFLTGPRKRAWGYDVNGVWMPWEEYHKIKKTL
jgi:hypothetical protein